MVDEENTVENAKPPVWFWVVCAVALIWNLLGLLAFVGHVLTVTNEEMLATRPADHQALYRDMPMWAHIVFALGVFGGVAGCVLLLLRKTWAMPVFIVSLVGVLAHSAYSFLLSDTVKVMGLVNMTPALLIVLIAIGLVLFSQFCASRNWIR